MIIIKKITIFSFILFIFLLNLNITQAAGPLSSGVLDDLKKQTTKAAEKSYNTGQANVGDTIALGIKAVLSVLGIIYLIMILIGGFKWMTAAGDEEQVNRSLGIIKRATIGLLIVISAYGIANFVFDALKSST